MPEMPNELDTFEVRNKKVVQIAIRKELHDFCLDLAQKSRRIGYAMTVYPIGMAILWTPEIDNLTAPEKWGVNGSAVFLSVGAAVLSEKWRRKHISDSKRIASDVIEISQAAPSVPTPNWAKQALGFETE